MTQHRAGRPLVPEDRHSYQPPPCVARAAIARARHTLDPLRHRSAEDAADAAWPGDKATLAVLEKAASSPHSTASAAVLATNAIGEFLGSLAPISAAASLFAACPRIALGSNATLTLPHRADPLAAGDSVWVDEGAPSPVARHDVANAATLGPAKKMIAIAAASRELVEASDAESIIDLMLRESAGYSLDLAVFSAAAATSARPAGLLNGIAPLTPSAATDKNVAMLDDLAALASAIASAGSGLAFVAHAKQANAIKLRRGAFGPADVPVWPTIAAASGVVLAVDPACIVSAFGSDPEIRASNQAAMHFEDASPAALMTASPVGSLWQTDTIALRLILRAAWCLRVPGAIAWLTTAW